MKYHCDRCGHDCRNKQWHFDYVFIGDLIELRDIYQTKYVKLLCKSCVKTADSFLDYWGVKKDSDRKALNDFLRSGLVSSAAEIKAYNGMVNAGYY